MGIYQGPSIKWHTQLISSFYWAKPRLGPVAAKNVADLFEGELYEIIRETPPELAFQLYLLDVVLWESRSDLAKDKVYIRNLRSYEYFALYSLVVRALTELGVCWGDADFTAQLHGQWPQYYPTHYNRWRELAKECIDHIVAALEKEARRYVRETGQELTYANYFKSQSAVARMLNARLPRRIKSSARAALKD